MDHTLHYALTLATPGSNDLQVSLSFTPQNAKTVLWLPNWIPGSYKIRDFAKNIVSISAYLDEEPIPVTQIEKNRFIIEGHGQKIRVEYVVYAKDMSVRTAYLDKHVLFFNPASICLAIEDELERPCAIQLSALKNDFSKKASVACALPTQQEHGFGKYDAKNYDELIDSPFLIGDLDWIAFDAKGVKHEVALLDPPAYDKKRVAKDLQKLCEVQIDFFKSSPVKDKYVFLIWLVGNGYGGLEHQSCCALIAERWNLPVMGDKSLSDGYAEFLSLCSHEYFHTWWVKAIRPQGFLHYQLSHEQYTHLLWMFEGFTAYYEDELLFRAGIFSLEKYLKMLSGKINHFLKNPSYQVQSLKDSSFCAWTKFYDPNENSPNAVVSYYIKGAILAWGIDAYLHTLGKSLDDFVLQAWQNAQQGECEVSEDALSVWLNEQGVKYDLEIWVNQPGSLPIAEWAKMRGWQWRVDQSDQKIYTGIRLKPGQKIISVVEAGSPAQQAGICAGDEWIACDDWAITPDKVDEILKRYHPGDHVVCMIIRDGRLRSYQMLWSKTSALEGLVGALYCK